MRIIMLGAPGSGKGTIAKKIKKELNIPQISTGDILRGAVKAGTELGKEAQGFMKRGELVPDALILGIVKERISAADCAEGFIFDGFPRTLVQAAGLEELLSGLGIAIDAVINVFVPDDEIVRRIAARRTCTNTACQAIFNLDYNPPKVEGICNVCGATVVQREDEREDVVRHRLAVYTEMTEPLINYYDKQGLVFTPDGESSDEKFAGVKAKML